MSEDNNGQRDPSTWVKRQPTTGQALANTTAMGATASYASLLALYINQCLTDHHWVVPSTEMIIALIGLAAPFVHLLLRVAKTKLDKWAADSGVS